MWVSWWIETCFPTVIYIAAMCGFMWLKLMSPVCSACRDRQTDRHTQTHRYGHTYRQTVGWVDRQTDKQMNTQGGRHVDNEWTDKHMPGWLNNSYFTTVHANSQTNRLHIPVGWQSDPTLVAVNNPLFTNYDSGSTFGYNTTTKMMKPLPTKHSVWGPFTWLNFGVLGKAHLQQQKTTVKEKAMKATSRKLQMQLSERCTLKSPHIRPPVCRKGDSAVVLEEWTS